MNEFGFVLVNDKETFKQIKRAFKKRTYNSLDGYGFGSIRTGKKAVTLYNIHKNDYTCLIY